MNWFLTSIFYVVIVSYYYFVGDLSFYLLKYKKKMGLSKILFGFLFVTFICFIVGVPSQLLRISWNIYAIVLSIIHLIIIGMIIKYRLTTIQKDIIKFKENWRSYLLIHFKNYWFIYFMIFAFSILSMTNLLAYYQQNYDDTYYISKVVQSAHSMSIGSENAFNGSMIDTIEGGFIRIFNTYELTYSYFGTIFGIDLSFFCRATMVIHNYFIVFVTYIVLARKFIKKELSQYTIAPFLIFLIVSGYLTEHGLPFIDYIRSYDLWQFQTAMFYGGSLVRSMALPLLILLLLPLIKKVTFKRVILLIVSCCAMLSFSTIFIQQAILVILIAIFIKSIYLLKDLKWKAVIQFLLGICFSVIMYIGLVYINKYMCNTNSLYVSGMEQFPIYYNYYVDFDAIMQYALLLIVVGTLIYRKIKFSLMASILLILYFIVTKNAFEHVLSITSFGYFFVSMRTIASLQYMIVFLVGLIFVKGMSYIKYSRIISSMSVIGVALVVGLFIKVNYVEITDYDYQGSGISSLGYSTEVLVNNDQMMPDIFVEIGEYFDTLEYANYRLYTQEIMEYNDTELHTAGLVFTSNRIETCTYEGCDNISVEEKHVLNNFTSIQQVLEILTYRDIKYILITHKENADLLVENGGTLEKEFESKTGEDYYLVKAPEL